MTKAVDKIRAGLGDARAYLNGDHAGFAVHEIEVSCPDVVAIRSKTGLSQPAFARSIGHSARHAQELGAGPPLAGGTGARAARAD